MATKRYHAELLSKRK